MKKLSVMQRGLDGPNAWIASIQALGAHLERVYARTDGEVWLFDNDLRVLADHQGAFEILYKDIIDGSVAEHVRCVKILVKESLFREFEGKVGDNRLRKNLRKLRRSRLRTFYIGCLERVVPSIPKELGGHDPWIFYLADQHLARPGGFVIVRPSYYPFKHEDPLEDVALAWETGGAHEHIKMRLANNRWFRKVFVEDFESNFESLEPYPPSGRIKEFRLVQPRGAEAVRAIRTRLRNQSPRPVTTPVDIGIITALDEETRAVAEQFGLEWSAGEGVYSGWCHMGGRSVSVVAIQSPYSGSVYSSITALKIINQWRPGALFLVGRCGGWREGAGERGSLKRYEVDTLEGDVVIADQVVAYEYQAVRVEGSGKLKVAYDVRVVGVANSLLTVARMLKAGEWRYRGPGYPEAWMGRRQCKAIVGPVASGCKVVKAGGAWFPELRSLLNNRKILATEMEGEGVGEAARDVRPEVPFLMVKGISDFADSDKGDGYNELACRSAARFAHDLIGKLQG